VKAHILIVDDDLIMAKMLTFVLSDNGYQTSMLPDPAAVPRFLDEHPVNLVLLDVALPHTDSRTLYATIQRTHPDLPVLLLTTPVTEPFEPMDLLLRIRAILSRP